MLSHLCYHIQAITHVHLFPSRMDDDGGDRWRGRKENERNSYLTSIGGQVNNDGDGASELVSLLVGEVAARKKKRATEETGFQN
ncbi:hypothetical protein QVD17_41395 [Tagetes erecta]|uniref:Uncharacterized protein n=1 Tax=Tagetes erecta TaxID=13708 RepID=A0AAD8JME5_TARER|nr:hypothetical protein QVD17_41395 [Tagetes erecta]